MQTVVMLAFLRFEQPFYLWLLLLIPLMVWMALRSLSGLDPVRRVLAILFRAAVIVLATFALAGASRVKTTDDLTVLFLMDRSNSVPRAEQRRAFGRVEDAAEADARKRDDRVGIVAFDGVASVEQLPMSALAIDRVGDAIEPDNTDIASALRLSMALFPPDSARRIVVVSDGNENYGEALREADNLRAARVPVDVIPVSYEHGSEVVFEQLRTPPTAATDETINVQMVLRAQEPTAGRVILYHNDRLIDFGEPGGPGFPVMLEAGSNRVVRKIPLRSSGAHRFRAVFEPAQQTEDTIAANNEGTSFTVVSGPGKVLILTTADDMNLPTPSALVLQQALEREKLTSDVEVAGSNPIDQVRLLEYSLVILDNVPRNDLTEDAAKAISAFVRDTGGGLIMLGGDQSFGAGGWMDSPIEDVMPVSFEIKNKKQFPKGALVLVMHACEVPNGNFIGERCAVSAIKTLSTRDLVGVLSYRWTGDQNGFWDIPLQTVGNKTRIIQKVMNMQMGDMPDMHEVMKPGVDALADRKDAAVKHMIIVSDFDPMPPTQALINKMKKANITCSTIAIGYGGHMIDEPKAKWIARSTGGKFYATKNFSELPKIFIKEARTVQQALIQETPFTPQVSNALPSTVRMLIGEGLPQLGGFVLTTPKPTADITLVRATSEGQDPIMAQWHVGLGKAVAFTSGMWSRWGNDWANWSKFSPLWGQIARWAARDGDDASLDVTTTIQNGVGRIRVEALDQNASLVNNLTINGSLIRPDQNSESLKLTQVGPGKYEAEFDATQQGNFIVNLGYVMGTGQNAKAGSFRTGVSVAYSPEFQELSTNLPLLEELTARTKGRNLGTNAANASVFDRGSLPKTETRRPIWEDLIRWMLVIFLLDVAIRRIALNPIAMWRRFRGRVAEMGGRGRTAQSAEVLSSLKGVRDKARDQQTGAGGTDQSKGGEAIPQPNRSKKYEAADSPNRSTEELSQALGGATEQDKPVVAKPTRHKPAASEADYTSRLLAAKRRAKKDAEEEGE